jgi:hypothetical protein
MTKWIVLCRVTRDGAPTDRWDIVSECLDKGTAETEFGYYGSLYGPERVRLFVDYLQLQAGDI